jgi:hypothetical protein
MASIETKGYNLACRLHLIAYPSENESKISEIAPRVAAAILKARSPQEAAPAVMYAGAGSRDNYVRAHAQAAAVYAAAHNKSLSPAPRKVLVLESLEEALSFLGMNKLQEVVNFGDFGLAIAFFSTKTDPSIVRAVKAAIPSACTLTYLTDLFPSEDGRKLPNIFNKIASTPMSLTQAETCARKCAESGRDDCRCDAHEDPAALATAVYGAKPFASGDLDYDSSTADPRGASDVSVLGRLVPSEVAASAKVSGLIDILGTQQRARLAAAGASPNDTVAAATESEARVRGAKPDVSLPADIADAAAAGMGPSDRHVIYARDPKTLAVVSAMLDRIGVKHATVSSSSSFDVHHTVIDNLFNGADGRYGRPNPSSVHTAALSAMRAEAEAHRIQALHAARAFKCAVRKDYAAGRIPAYRGDRDDQAVVEETVEMQLIAREVPLGDGTLPPAAVIDSQMVRAAAAAGDPANVAFTRDAPWVLLTDSPPVIRPRGVQHLHILDGGGEALDIAKSLYGREEDYHVPRLQVLSHVSIVPPSITDDEFGDALAPHEDDTVGLYTDGECDGAGDEDPGACVGLDEYGIAHTPYDYTGYLTVRTKVDNRKTVRETRETEVMDGSGRRDVETAVTTFVRPTESSENVYVRKYDIFTCDGSKARRARRAADAAIGPHATTATASQRLIGDETAAPKIVSCFDDSLAFAPSDAVVGNGAPRRVRGYENVKPHQHDVARALEALERFDAYFSNAADLMNTGDHISLGEFRKKLSERMEVAP